MSRISVVEAVKSSEKPKPKPKTLAHIEIHAKLGGGHMVKHVYEGYDHEPKMHHFNEKGYSQGGKHVMDHLKEHAGLPEPQNEEADEEKVAPGIHKRVAKLQKEREAEEGEE